MQTLKTGLQRITPDIAMQLLRNNSQNRPVRQGYVERLARAMSNGDWVINGEPIVVGHSGRLLNGQHRLLAVIESGATIESYVVTDVRNEDGAFRTMDSGVKRTAGDWFDLRGYSNSKRLAAGLRMMWEYKIGFGQKSATGASTSELSSLLERHPSFAERIVHISPANRITSPALTDFLSYTVTYNHENRDRGEQFIESLLNGVGLQKDDPSYLLRQRLISNRGSALKLSRIDLVWLCIKAWNHYVQGKSIQILKVLQSETPMELLGFPRSSV